MTEWGPGLAVILGIVEGLTEYLPVSSTGHLILVGHWLGFTGEVADTIDIAIQLGAILAVIVYERRKLSSFLTQAVREQRDLRTMVRSCSGGGPAGKWLPILKLSTKQHSSLWFLIGLLAAFLPAGIIGFLTHHWIERHLFNPQSVAAALIIGGIIILLVERLRLEARVTELGKVPIPIALWVGLAQCASLIPGTSRSGATIIGGLLAGMDRRVAAEYSFFLALPTLTIATTYKMIKAGAVLSGQDLLALGIGLVVSFFVAWAVIAGFIAYVQHHTLKVFAYYRMVLGVAVFLLVK